MIYPLLHRCSRSPLATVMAFLVVASMATPTPIEAAKKKEPATPAQDPFEHLVWPPPPDKARIKLERVLAGRVDVEGTSKLKKFLIGLTETSPYDRLKKPFAVAFDSQGRILVTDFETRALVRFDTEGGVMDVLGTGGRLPIQQPLGLAIGPDETIYVTDNGRKMVIALTSEGDLVGAFGNQGDLQNPTDSAVSPDNEHLYVADSKAHEIVVYRREDASLVSRIGGPGMDAGKFHYPTSLAFGPEGRLFVVDQLNARVQVLAEDGEFEFEFGGRGVGFGSFVRPKDIAVDEIGFIYVTDNAFNNVQIFDYDGTLLTFVGETGTVPGRFHGASGIAVQGERFAVVDQLGHRIQIFRFIVPKEEE